MPYKHAGEISDVWKHLPLCDILQSEKPIRYHETNSANSHYKIDANPNTEYGIINVISKSKNNKALERSKYLSILREKGIGEMNYLGSPGLSMETLCDSADYFFHDLDIDAIECIKNYASQNNLLHKVTTFCGDSISALLKNSYQVNKNDFIFIDPYCPFDKNTEGDDFFDVFEKTLTCKSKVLLWYGYVTHEIKRKIAERFNYLASKNKTKMWRFDIWLKNMPETKVGIHPGVAGCGLACANLSHNSLKILMKYLDIITCCYTDSVYLNLDATLLSEKTEYN